AHVGCKEQGNFMGGGLDLAALGRRVTGGGHYEGNAPLEANRKDGHGPLRGGEVDDDLQTFFEGQLRLHRHVEGADAGHLANVPADKGMSKGFERCREPEFVIILGQLNDAQPHAPARAVHAKGDFHVCEPLYYEYTSMALMISSRSLATCTARLA